MVKLLNLYLLEIIMKTITIIIKIIIKLKELQIKKDLRMDGI